VPSIAVVPVQAAAAAAVVVAVLRNAPSVVTVPATLILPTSTAVPEPTRISMATIETTLIETTTTTIATIEIRETTIGLALAVPLTIATITETADHVVVVVVPSCV
jgi:hypothetical protein